MTFYNPWHYKPWHFTIHDTLAANLLLPFLPYWLLEKYCRGGGTHSLRWAPIAINCLLRHAECSVLAILYLFPSNYYIFSSLPNSKSCLVIGTCLNCVPYNNNNNIFCWTIWIWNPFFEVEAINTFFFVFYVFLIEEIGKGLHNKGV